MFRLFGSLGLWAALLTAGCQESGGQRACLAEALGGFAFEALSAREGGGCRARYRDERGRRALADVFPCRGGELAEESAPVAFERHLVFSQIVEGGLRARWYRGETCLSVWVEGLERPEGPVLRAYLLRYPSEVIDEVAARQQEILRLRHDAREVPRDAGVHLALARNYLKLGDTIMAAQEYHIALDKDRRCFECYLELGQLYRGLRHWDLAIRALRKAVALRPDSLPALLELGDLSWEVHNRAEALSAYEAALRLDLEAAERRRLEGRLDELRAGKFQIELLPSALHPPTDGGDGGDGG